MEDLSYKTATPAPYCVYHRPRAFFPFDLLKEMLDGLENACDVILFSIFPR
jgi:hypothetical protein